MPRHRQPGGRVRVNFGGALVSGWGATLQAVALAGMFAALQCAHAQGKQGIDAQSQKATDAQAQAAGNPEPEKSDTILRVCADPSGLPQSNDRGEGYENKIAEALGRDLGRKVQQQGREALDLEVGLLLQLRGHLVQPGLDLGLGRVLLHDY